MQEKEIIIFGITSHFAAEPLHTLVKQDKFYTIDMILTPYNFFRVKVILQIITIHYR